MDEQEELEIDWEAFEYLKIKRGYYGTSNSDQTNTILVNAPVEKVAQAIVQLNPTARWEANALNRSIQIGQQGVLIYQLQTHTWSQLIYVMCEVQRIPNALIGNFPRKLSAHLGAQVIDYSNSDTVCCSHFELFDSGESKVAITTDPEQSDSLEKEWQIDDQFKTLDALEATIKPYELLEGNYCENESVRVKIDGGEVYGADGILRRMTYPIERVDYICLL